MKYYYYSEKDQQLGPFLKEDLKQKLIKKDTLVWTDGLAEWVTAESLEDLKDIIVSLPPPLPKKNIQPKKPETVHISKKVDIKSSEIENKSLEIEKSNDNSSIIVGFFSFGLYYLLINNINNSSVSIESYFANYYGALILILIFRIIATIWATKIAYRKNRNTTGWGIITFIFPGLSLIILGLIKKSRLFIKINGNLSKDQQVEILLKNATKLYENKRYSECLELLNKGNEIDPINNDILNYRANTNYKLGNLIDSKVDFKHLTTDTQYASNSNYYLGIIEFNDNKQTSLDYLKNAVELGHVYAQPLIDKLFTFSGVYLLDEIQVKRKIGTILTPIYLKSNYIEGIDLISALTKEYEYIETNFKINDFGVIIEIETYSYKLKGINKKISYLGILYGEILELEIDDLKEFFEIRLKELSIKFSIENSNIFEDNIDSFLTKCQEFKENKIDLDFCIKSNLSYDVIENY